MARRVGIKGCVAADRILALAPDGSSFPCSQLVHPSCHVGNLLQMEPKQMWDQSKVLRRYRSFRTKKSFTHSWCGICVSKNTCGGCRVFAEDGLGGDPGCPEPLLPQLTRLGKIGRSLDYEQVAEWIQDPLYLEDYPAWIKEYGSRNSGSLTSSAKEKNERT